MKYDYDIETCMRGGDIWHIIYLWAYKSNILKKGHGIKFSNKVHVGIASEDRLSEFASSLGCPQRQLWVFKKTPLKKNDHNHHDIME